MSDECEVKKMAKGSILDGNAYKKKGGVLNAEVEKVEIKAPYGLMHTPIAADGARKGRVKKDIGKVNETAIAFS